MSADQHERPQQPTIAELLAELTWEELTADGIVTIEQVEEALRERGYEPGKYDYLYEVDADPPPSPDEGSDRVGGAAEPD